MWPVSRLRRWCCRGVAQLGALEFGAARARFEQKITPDLIVLGSIGAITAVLLARPVARLGPLGALETFWKTVTVPGFLLPAPVGPYAPFFGNPHFFTIRPDFLWPITGRRWGARVFFLLPPRQRRAIPFVVRLGCTLDRGDTMREPIHLLLLVVAALAANGVEGQSRTPLDETHALIVNSGSTNFPGFSLNLAEDGEAKLKQGNSTFQRYLPQNLTTRLFADLRAAGELDALPRSRCMKSASFGTTTRVFYRGKTSPDVSCPSPNPLLRRLATDVMSLLDAADITTIPRRANPP